MSKFFISPFIFIGVLAGLGIVMLYSAANGSMHPWAMKQLIRLAIGIGAMIVMSRLQVRTLYSMAYGVYSVALLALIAVELLGFVGMGAQRWINLGVISLQPSELMRIGMILALARYFHELPQERINEPMQLIIPVMLMIIPILLVLKQPDLGTATLLILSGLTIFFMAQVNIWYFISLGGLLLVSVPLLWPLLHDYQKKRILIFLNPESDPTRSGYHIIQSKIAMGSGGLWGKGFLNGTQSHFDFLPEKQTDFIFTMFCEEFGFIGAVVLIGLYCVLIGYNMRIAYYAKGLFAKLVASGLAMTLFLYMFINMAMVMGLLPVVGVPLPLFSYGGTAMLTLLMSQGILLALHKKGYMG